MLQGNDVWCAGVVDRQQFLTVDLGNKSEHFIANFADRFQFCYKLALWRSENFHYFSTEWNNTQTIFVGHYPLRGVCLRQVHVRFIRSCGSQLGAYRVLFYVWSF